MNNDKLKEFSKLERFFIEHYISQKTGIFKWLSIESQITLFFHDYKQK